jgi:methylenetetrahydrofolate reductase (NADPH)
MNQLRTALEAGGFICSAELVLNRDHSVPDAEAFVLDASRESRGVKVISLTDLPGGNPSLPPESFASFVIEHHLTPLTHLTGKDGNRSIIEGRLHACARIGADNILALTGDVPKSAFQGKAKPVFDLDSVLILGLIRALGEGLEYSIGKRHAKTSPFDYFAGAVVNPYKVREPDQMMQFHKLELKIAAGARFIITQLGFDLRKLCELRQYLLREGMAHVPVIASIYVPTAVTAGLMQAGDIPGCIIPDKLRRRLEGESKSERLERAALMLAAVRGLGFAGGHIGGFGLTHTNCLQVMDRAAEIGQDWKKSIDELNYETPGMFYLLPPATDGLSQADGAYQLMHRERHFSFKRWMSGAIHRFMIAPQSFGAHFLKERLQRERACDETPPRQIGLWHALLGLSSIYRKTALGCMNCGDCIQDHLNYVGCTMRWCHKNLRNGPCGGSRGDGSCEADPDLPCIWNSIYLGAIAAGDDPRRFARTLIPSRDWRLDQTNALTNCLTGSDNLGKRIVTVK